jgi:hypothetical protein
MNASLESYGDRQILTSEFERGRKQLRRPLQHLRTLLSCRIELMEYGKKLQIPDFYGRVERERAGRVLWLLWAVVTITALGFDTSFTFSSTAASLRDSLSRLFPFASSHLDFWVALVVSVTVLSITLSVRLSTESLKQREQLNLTPADSAEVPMLLASIQRKKFVRTAWAAALTVLLATAAISDLLTIQAYSEMGNSPAPVKARSLVQEDDVSFRATFAQMLQLVTPYGITTVLHFLILFVPLPASSPFLPYPCAPDGIERALRRVDQRIGHTGKQLFEIVMALRNDTVRTQLLAILGQDESGAVKAAVGDRFFDDLSSGRPSKNPPANN